MSNTISPAETDESYIILENLVRDRIAANRAPLFTTTATPEALWAAYLDGLPANRQHYSCHSCRRFVQAYGGLVTIDADGTQRSLLWQGAEEVPPFFAASVQALVTLISRSRVDGVFLSSDSTWGTPSTADKKRKKTWSHLAATNPSAYRGGSLSASQKMAEKLEDHGMLRRGLAEYPAKVVAEALRVLKSDALARSEKVVLHADWLAKLHAAKDPNSVWLAVAEAPAGWCHVKTTMISTLLEDVSAGLDFAEIKRRWEEKMHPLQYQRPTAAPKEGAIEVAEKLVEKLGLARSLERRYATLEDVRSQIWVPRAPEPEAKPEGVFGHLRGQAEGVRSVQLPPKTMTWEKFRREVLSSARTLEVKVPSHAASFFGLVTATHADAPPILQWDREESRNPVSWYFRVYGSHASEWGLQAGSWTKVNAVFPGPPHWFAPELSKHHAEVALFALEGSEDHHSSTLCLFPETLRADLHGIRSVVEAHSASGKLTGGEAANANGLALMRGSTGREGITVRVDGDAVYGIDRWD